MDSIEENFKKVIAILSTICTFFCVGLFDMSRKIVAAIIVICIAIIVGTSVILYLSDEKIKEMAKGRVKKNRDKLETMMLTQYDISDTQQIDAVKKEYRRTLRGCFLKNVIRDIKKERGGIVRKVANLRIIAFLLLCIVTVTNTRFHALAKEAFLTIVETFTALEPVEEEPRQDPVVDMDPEPALETQPEPEIIDNTEEWVRFQLVYPNGYPFIDGDELNKLYGLIFYEEADNLNDKIKSEISIWKNSCNEPVPLDKAVTNAGNSAHYYSEIEKRFYEKDAAMLLSSVLDEVIFGREELLESYPNPTLAWLLANNMQLYALNYLNQESCDAKSVLYFYMQSIYYAQRSLEFMADIETKNNRMKYIQSRYQDIADCKAIDSHIRDRAGEIAAAFQEALK